MSVPIMSPDSPGILKIADFDALFHWNDANWAHNWYCFFIVERGAPNNYFRNLLWDYLNWVATTQKYTGARPRRTFLAPPMSAKTMIFDQEKNKARRYSFRRFLSQLFTPPILRPSLDHRGRRFFFPFATIERLKNVRQTSPAHPPKPVRYGWGN